MYPGIEFFTATCLNSQSLLAKEKHKGIVMESFNFLVREKRIWLYGYVILPNHIHTLWRKQDEWMIKAFSSFFEIYRTEDKI